MSKATKGYRSFICIQPMAWLCLCILFGVSHSLWADTEEDGRYWFSLYTQGPLTLKQTFWSMDVQPRWREEGQAFDQVILRPAVFYRLNPNASVWLGYDTIITHPQDSSVFREHRWWQQLQYQFDPFDDVTLVSRTRLEQRDREDFSDTAHRLRQMFRATVPSSLHPKLSWLVFDEIFIHLNDTAWGVEHGFDQNRLLIGAHWKFDQTSNLDIGYLHQYINGQTIDRENHVLSTTFRFNF